MEVPEIMLKSTDLPAVSVVATGDHAAKIFTPGPVISGCNGIHIVEGSMLKHFFLTLF